MTNAAPSDLQCAILCQFEYIHVSFVAGMNITIVFLYTLLKVITSPVSFIHITMYSFVECNHYFYRELISQ